MARTKRMRRRVGLVFAVAIAAFFALDMGVVLALWPQLRRADALSAQYAANSTLIARMTGVLPGIRSSATEVHVWTRVGSQATGTTDDPVASARREFEAAAAEYEEVPMGPAEAEAWRELSGEAYPAVLRAIDEVVAPGRSGAGVDQPAIDRLTAATRRVGLLLERLATLNARGLDATGKQMRSTVALLVFVCIAVGTVGTVGGLVLVRWALTAVRNYERSTNERLAELEEFAGRVAHDLRNPLQTIGLSLAVIQQRAPDDALRTTVERARDSTRRMSSFIQELLEFARSGARPVPGAAAQVREVLRGVEQDLAVCAQQEGVALVVRAPDDLCAAITPEALRAVVGNLADNAVKHMRSEDGAARRVEVVAENGQEGARITVRDTGAGIAADALPHLFEPFFRGATRSGGFGIGLKTVKRIVDAYGGTIAVDSKPGRGTVFTVALPLPSPSRATGAAAK
jgi:signal transduction histidine kinase